MKTGKDIHHQRFFLGMKMSIIRKLGMEISTYHSQEYQNPNPFILISRLVWRVFAKSSLILLPSLKQ